MGQICTTERSNSSKSSSVVLTAENINNLKESWKLVAIAGFREYGTKMMIRIFLEHKELKPLWKFARHLDSAEQMNASQLIKQHGEKLFTTIDTALNMIPNDLQTLVPVLHQLGYVHYKYGARPEHFQIVGAALIGTLEDNLKEDFTDKIRKAWLNFFAIVESEMRVGMQNAKNEELKAKLNSESQIA